MAEESRTDRYAAAAPLRARLARRVVTAGPLTDPAWRTAFEEIPRHLFVPVYHRPRPSGGYTRLSAGDRDPRNRARWLAGAYADAPLVTCVRGGQPVPSSSQPSLMAAMLETLQVAQGQRVLEVGAGTGCNAALLAHRPGPSAVITADLDPRIASDARRHLAAAGFAEVTVVTGDGGLGCPQGAPYDRIMATCELPSIPLPWLEQSRPGALVVGPLGGGLIALRVADAAHAEGRFLPSPAFFVSLRGAGAVAHPSPEAVGSQERVRATGVPPQVLDSELFRFVVTLVAGELEVRRAFGGRGASVTAADGSAARVDRDGAVLTAGPRDLWALVEETYDLWLRAGRPERDRFGLTVDGDRQWTWLDTPGGPHRWRLAGCAGC